MGIPSGKKKRSSGILLVGLGVALFELIMVRYDVFIRALLVILVCCVDLILALVSKGSFLFVFIALLDAIVVRALTLYRPGCCEGVFFRDLLMLTVTHLLMLTDYFSQP